MQTKKKMPECSIVGSRQRYTYRELQTIQMKLILLCVLARVSVQGVESLWGDCRFIPADWGS